MKHYKPLADTESIIFCSVYENQWERKILKKSEVNNYFQRKINYTQANFSTETTKTEKRQYNFQNEDGNKGKDISYKQELKTFCQKIYTTENIKGILLTKVKCKGKSKYGGISKRKQMI